MSSRRQRGLFRAFLTDFVDYGIAIAAVSMATYLPLFLRTHGASDVVIGLLPGAFAAGRMTGLLAAPRLECRPLIHRWMVGAMLVERLPLSLMGVWILLSVGRSPAVVVTGVMALWIVYSLNNGWASTAWGAYVARSLSPGERGRLSGWGNALGALSGLAVVPLVRAAIDRYGLAVGYGSAVALGGLLITFSALVYLLPGETPYPHVTARLGLGAYLRRTAPALRADARFRWFLAAMALWLAGTTGISYYTVYAMQRFQADTSAVMGYTLAMACGSGMAGLAGGQAAHRRGFGALCSLGIVLVAGANLVAWAAPEPSWMYVAFALAGAGSTASWMGVVNLPLELADRETVPTYTAVAALVRGPVGALSPLLAGLYLEHGSYPQLFLLGVALCLLAAACMHGRVGEPRAADAADPPRPKVGEPGAAPPAT